MSVRTIELLIQQQRIELRFENTGRQVLRKTFCVALGVFLLNTGIWGQQLKAREDQAEPTTGWRKVDETKVSLPAGTMLAVRLIDPVSSDKSQAGDRFHGSLDAPVVVGGTVVADQGSTVVGRVVRARKAGRITAPSELVLELVELVLPADRVRIETDPIERIGESTTGAGSAAAIGSTAALGTALGAIFGGGKGAAIGAAAGGAVGAGGTLGAKGKQSQVKSETVLMFRLRSPATVTVLEKKEVQQ
jgi:hypothetical protein